MYVAQGIVVSQALVLGYCETKIKCFFNNKNSNKASFKKSGTSINGQS